MLAKVRQSLQLLDPKERVLVLLLTALRAILGLLDILGIFLIGLLIARATNQIVALESSSKNFEKILLAVGNISLIQIASLALFLFLAKSLSASLLIKYMTNRFAKAESEIVTATYLQILRSPISKVSKFSQSEIIYSLTYSSGFAVTQLLSVMVIILSEFFLLILVTIVFALVDPVMTLFMLLYFMIVGVFIYRAIGSKFEKAGRKYANSAISASTSVEDSLVAFRELFALKKQGGFKLKFAESRYGLAQSNASIYYLSGLPRYIIESALMVGGMALLVFALNSDNPEVAAAKLGIFLTGALRIMASMLPLQNSLGSFKQLAAQAESFFQLNREFPSDIGRAETLCNLNASNNNLEGIGVHLDQVSYTYELSDYPAVNGVSIDVVKGNTVAFIGQSGSGKSTLADLIAGLLSPNSGNLVLENSDQRSIGYVPQTPGIISGTIAQNITLNINGEIFDQERLDRALSLAHLTDLVSSLEDGVDTDLGAQSDDLSGGQLQRIGLARAIYANPGLLILDEATSALDAETEAAVSESLKTLHGSCTTIVIAHRLSTIQNADIVHVFDKGEIVASGKFAELVKTNKIVARFVELSTLDITN